MNWRSLFAKSVLALGLLSTAVDADEVIRVDGVHSAGKISLDETGRLCFIATGEKVPTPSARIRTYLPAPSKPTPCRDGAGHCVLLRSGERLTGQLIEWKPEAITLNILGSNRASIPRGEVTAVTQIPGRQTWLADEQLKAWKPTGKVKFADGAVLSAPGQALVYILPRPMSAGEFSINFTKTARGSNSRWFVEAEFQDGKTIQTAVADSGDAYHVDTQGLEGVSRSALRTEGLHRLTIRFGSHSMAVLCDDDVLWHNLKQGPNGPLCQIRLACVAEKKAGPTMGEVKWRDFALVAAADEAKRPPGDPTQDEVLLATGDQIFGDILDVNRTSIVLRLPTATKTLPWNRVQGCYFRDSPVKPKIQDGEQVRLHLHAPFGGAPDLLDGVLTRLDDKGMVLRQRLLGVIVLERGRVKEIRLLGKMTP